MPAQAVQSSTTTANAPPPSGSSRITELDALRGVMLIWMTLTHLPTHANVYSNQMLGFVSAAEGFIFLSAFLTGLIFTRKYIQNGFRAVAAKLFARAFRLYLYHLALLALAFTVVARVAVHTNQPSLTGLLDFYLAHPVRGVVTSILLIYRPPLLDILPMYILFLALTPLVIAAGRRFGWRYVLIPSALIWLAAQFGLRGAFYGATFQWFHIDVPFSALGAFDLFAWQLLWIFGVASGSGELLSAERLRRSWPVLSLLAMTFFIARHTHLWDVANAPPWEPYIDKWRLGVLRLVNFGCLAALFASFRGELAPLLNVAPLLTLGRASLEVFCAHLLICFEALALVGDGNGLPWISQGAIIVSSLAALYIVGRAFSASTT